MLRLFKHINLSLLLILFLSVSVGADEQTMADLNLTPTDRVLILAPHPDDEVLGAGGLIQHALSMKLPVKVAFFTYGDSNQWSFLLYRKHPVFMPGAVQKMGLVRRDEALEASSILGVGSENTVFLGYPDFGTLNIWYSHWGQRSPYRSLMTRVTAVPYQGALRPGALYKGEEIIKDLRSVIRDFKPTKIFVSHPADHNGDHLSLYLYLRVALWDEGLDRQVEIYPYLVHYLGWPKLKGFHPDIDLVPPQALEKNGRWVQYRLTPQELEIKRKALEAHKSQFRSSPKYLLSFIKNNEIFGDFSEVTLHMNEKSSVFSARKKFISALELPEEYSDREKSAYVGVEWKFLRWEGDNIIVSIDLSKPLAQDVEASIYFFGYNSKIPFEQMPKINVRLGVLSYSVYDQNKKIDQQSVLLKRTAQDITLAVPVKLLGNPEKILTSARTYLGNVPLDSASWVAVELK